MGRLLLIVAFCAGLGLLSKCTGASEIDGGGKDLEKTFKRLDFFVDGRPKEEQKTLIREQLDLARPEVSTFVLEKLNHVPLNWDEHGYHVGIACIIEENPEKALIWLFDNFDHITAYGRKNMVWSMLGLDSREAYDIPRVFLKDKTVVEEKELGEPSTEKVYPMRVCDYAHGVIYGKLLNERKVPRNHGIDHSMPPTERDVRIQWLVAWLSGEGKGILAARKALPSPEIAKKIDGLYIKMNTKVPTEAPTEKEVK